MCGRYILSDANWQTYHDGLNIIRPTVDDLGGLVDWVGQADGSELAANGLTGGGIAGDDVSYNICPTQYVAVALPGPPGRDGGARLMATRLRWGLVPGWFKDPVSDWKAATFNARVEDAYSKPTFRGAWRYGRCLIPASGYFEWSGQKGDKTPHYITLTDNRPVFFFAGLYAVAGEITSCTILTRAAVPEIAHIHHRMPVILDDEQMLPWLAGAVKDDQVRAEYGLSVAGRLRHHPVHKFGLRDNNPGIIAPVAGG